MSAARVWIWPSGSVDALDHGLTVGDGVFETISVRKGVPMALSRHLARLGRSLNLLGLPEVPRQVIDEGIADVIANADPLARELGRLRITVTGGVGPLGSDRSSAEPTVVVALAPTNAWPATTSAVVVPWVRNERSAIAGAKSTSYAENVVALQWAHDQGFSEGVFLNTQGHLCEGTGTNVFCVIDGELVTPALDSGCLAGVARALVLEWCGGHERTIDSSELGAVTEVFLTSSTRDVHPVLKWRSAAGDMSWLEVGPITREVQEIFSQKLQSDPDPD